MENEELELLPCPLAHDGDRTAYIRKPLQWNLEGFCVECRGCGLSSIYFYTTPESAAQHWNRRAESPTVAQARAKAFEECRRIASEWETGQEVAKAIEAASKEARARLVEKP